MPGSEAEYDFVSAEPADRPRGTDLLFQALPGSSAAPSFRIPLVQHQRMMIGPCIRMGRISGTSVTLTQA
jgi:hypothetical protein